MNPARAAVIGNPVSQSLSPGIFLFISHHLKISNFDYDAEKVEPENLDKFITNVKKDQNTIGLNVTIPHKESVLSKLDQLTPEVRLIGAANVIQKSKHRLIGHNTDVHGIERTLEKHKCHITGKRVFVLGAGGAARAVAFVLGTQKAKQVEFLNNNFDRAEALSQSFAQAFPTTQFRAISQLPPEKSTDPIHLLINSTPLGMKGHPTTKKGELASDYFARFYDSLSHSISKNAYAFDLIYRPEQTPFLLTAKKLGITPMGGLDMLVEQAIQTWRIWQGPHPELDRIQSQLMDYLKHRPLFLSGFMGVGKTTIGPILAKKMGWQFLDIDSLIEQKSGMSISQIFETQGESGFREIEHKIISQYCLKPRTVIALGGGALSILSTRKMIEKSGQLIFLAAQPETLLERLKAQPNHRPLLKKILAKPNFPRIDPRTDIDAQIVHLTSFLRQRETDYNRAPLRIDTDNLTPEMVVQQIVEKI